MRGPSVLTSKNFPQGETDVVVAEKLSVVSHSCSQGSGGQLRNRGG